MEYDDLLHPGEVARMLGVDTKTLARWANLPAGHRSHIPSIKTLGGHRRYRRADVDAVLDGDN